MVIEVFTNRPFESRDAAEGAAADPPSRDLREESLDLVQPRTARRREMQLVFVMSQKPAFHGRRLVRRVVVEHEMDRDIRLSRQPDIDLVEELQEPLMPVPAMTLADDFSRGDVQGREQAGRAVPDIVVRVPLARSRLEGNSGWVRSSAWT